MSKKLLNEPERAVDEALAGLVAVHPGLQLLEGHRVVVRRDVQTLVSQGKVSQYITISHRSFNMHTWIESVSSKQILLNSVYV